MFALVLVAHSLAGQADRWTEDDATGHRQFHIVWDEADGHRRDTVFSLPLEAIAQDHLADEAVGPAEIRGARAAAVRAWAATLTPPERVRVSLDEHSLRWSVQAPDEAGRAALKARLEAVAREGADALMATVHRVRDADGVYQMDLAALVDRYAAPLVPVATALAEPMDGPEDFATRVLGFVQAIPYEARRVTMWGEPVGNNADEARLGTIEATVGYLGFRRPLALLDANTGDCDGKTVLYLAIVRARYPEVPLAAVRIPHHVYGGVAIPGWDPGSQFSHAGVSYTVVEPTGPGRRPPGTYQESSVGARRTVFPVPPAS